MTTQRAAVLPQETHQPDLGVDVEVVGRLVEAQHVAAGEQDAGELDTAPLTTGQHTDRRLDPVLTDAEPGGECTRFALGRVATVDPERFLGTGVPADVALVRRLLHRDAQLLDADELVVDAPTGQHVLDRGARLRRTFDLRVLREVAEAALAEHLAGRRLGRAAEHLEQRGLAGTVPADDADLVTGHDGEGGVVDDESTTHFHRECLRLEHPTRLRSRAMTATVTSGERSEGICPDGRADRLWLLPVGRRRVRGGQRPVRRRGCSSRAPSGR